MLKLWSANYEFHSTSKHMFSLRSWTKLVVILFSVSEHHTLHQGVQSKKFKFRPLFCGHLEYKTDLHRLNVLLFFSGELLHLCTSSNSVQTEFRQHTTLVTLRSHLRHADHCIFWRNVCFISETCSLFPTKRRMKWLCISSLTNWIPFRQRKSFG